MRKLWIAVVVVALAVAVVPVQASANHTLAHKVRKLQHKVTKLQRKVNCLRRTGASTYFGYAWYTGNLEPGGGPYPVHDPAADLTETEIAANFDQALGIRSSDYWLVTLKQSRKCGNRFRLVRNPYRGRIATRTAAMTRLHRLSRIQ